jgi:hypothetical protein
MADIHSFLNERIVESQVRRHVHTSETILHIELCEIHPR